MRLGSSALVDGATIPRRFTCDGEDLSPPLEWTGAPAEARSFVLLCDDPDAPAGTWHHWAAYDIPGEHVGLAEGASRHADKEGFKQAINDFHRGVMVVPARLAATALTTITSGCSRSRSITSRCARIPHAGTSNARPASI
jgi:phosphatidylethanolamine-binding protein (PEBP) family uncharacterized protein